MRRSGFGVRFIFCFPSRVHRPYPGVFGHATWRIHEIAASPTGHQEMRLKYTVNGFAGTAQNLDEKGRVYK